MQREGISTLNIYGTPQEPLCKNLYILAIKCCIKNIWWRRENKYIFYDFCTRRGCEPLVPTYHLSCNRDSGYSQFNSKFLKRGTMCTLIPYCTKGGTQALKVRNRGGCKNHKNIYFVTSTIHFIYNTFLQPKYTDFTKRFLRSTVDVQGDNTFPLHNQPPYLEYFPLFLGYSLFSHSFGNNKARWRFLF